MYGLFNICNWYNKVFDSTSFQRLRQKSFKTFRWFFGRNDDIKKILLKLTDHQVVCREIFFGQNPVNFGHSAVQEWIAGGGAELYTIRTTSVQCSAPFYVRAQPRRNSRKSLADVPSCAVLKPIFLAKRQCLVLVQCILYCYTIARQGLVQKKKKNNHAC